MANQSLNTPVLLLAFNRPKITKKVFSEIRKARPKKLFVAVDGPRKGNKKDKINVKEVRDIVKTVDWHCQLKTFFKKENKGLKEGIVESIDWFFKNV